MDAGGAWHICRIGYAETLIALTRAAGRSRRPVGLFRDEWPLFSIVEVDQELVEAAAVLASAEDLRTVDSLHLAAAAVPPHRDLVFATWDARLWRAAKNVGLRVLPAELE